MRASAGWAPSRRPASPPARPFVRFLGGALLRKTFCLFDSSFSLFVALKTGLAAVPHSGGSWNSRERRLPRSAQPLLRTRQPVRPPRLPYPPPAFVRRRKPTETSLMHPFQWCNGESRSGEASGLWDGQRCRGGRTVCHQSGLGLCS
jgi:hypothetical protein